MLKAVIEIDTCLQNPDFIVNLAGKAFLTILCHFYEMTAYFATNPGQKQPIMDDY